MKKQIQNSCLWILFTVLFGCCGVVGVLLFAIYTIFALTGGVVSAPILWTGFGMWFGGRFGVAIMSGIEKCSEKVD